MARSTTLTNRTLRAVLAAYTLDKLLNLLQMP